MAIEERSDARRLHAVRDRLTREGGIAQFFLKENGKSLHDRFVRSGKRDQQIVETSPFTLSRMMLVMVGENCAKIVLHGIFGKGHETKATPVRDGNI